MASPEASASIVFHHSFAVVNVLGVITLVKEVIPDPKTYIPAPSPLVAEQLVKVMEEKHNELYPAVISK